VPTEVLLREKPPGVRRTAIAKLKSAQIKL
jgi:hypothetical protein